MSCLKALIVSRVQEFIGLYSFFAVGLDSLLIESWWGERFSTPVQTGPGAHPVSCTVGTRSLSWG